MKAMEIERILWLISLSGVAQVDHCLEVEGLRKEVGEGDGFDLIAARHQVAEVAGECGGIAGDVDERRGGNLGEECGDFGAQASAGRVHNYQIRPG